MGEVVLQGDNVKDDRGYRAIFAEQGASQVAAVRLLDSMSRFSGMRVCQRRGVKLHAQVHMSEAPRLLGQPETESAHKCG